MKVVALFMPKYGYVRVSTVGQSKHGTSLNHQVNQLMSEGVPEQNMYIDHYTGSKMERPQFSKLFNQLKEDDVLVVTKLDRFARSLIEGVNIIDKLINRGVRINILNLGVLDNTPSSKLMRNIFLSFAEFERNLIIERTNEGKAIARQKEGFKEGRPKKYSQKQLDYALALLKTHSYKEIEEITKISKSTLIREKKRREKSTG